MLRCNQIWLDFLGKGLPDGMAVVTNIQFPQTLRATLSAFLRGFLIFPSDLSSLGQLASFVRGVKSEKLAPYNSMYALKKIGYFCLHVYMSVYHSGAWCPQRSEEDLRCLELELQMVVNHNEGAGNQPWDLWYSSQYC